MYKEALKSVKNIQDIQTMNFIVHPNCSFFLCVYFQARKAKYFGNIYPVAYLFHYMIHYFSISMFVDQLLKFGFCPKTKLFHYSQITYRIRFLFRDFLVLKARGSKSNTEINPYRINELVFSQK